MPPSAAKMPAKRIRPAKFAPLLNCAPCNGPVQFRRRGGRGRARVAIVLASVALVAGCGLQFGSDSGPVTLTITRNFGAVPLASTVGRVRAGVSAVALLKRHFKVLLGAQGSVLSIGGTAAATGERWRLYVNGVAAGERTGVHPGERLWWDLNDASSQSPAVVGAYPQPFLGGLGGRRLPVTVECGGDVRAACARVMAALTRLHVPAASQVLGVASGTDSLTIVVGTWQDIRQEVAGSLLEQGPSSSGVFARFSGPGGGSIQLLRSDGAASATLHGEAGLIAAMTQGNSPPTWLITGTGPAAVGTAADAFSTDPLRDHFALAISDGREIAVPR